MSSNNGGIVVFKKSDSGGIVLTNSKGKAARRVSGNPVSDIVFVIDTTGSMSGKIQSLLQTCQKFVDRIVDQQIDWRIAVVAFGDLTVHGDKIVATAFSNNFETVKRSIANVPMFNGGGNNGESSLEALDKALSFQAYRPEAIKVFILITDEPALKRTFKPEQITKRLQQEGVLTFVISDPQNYFKEMAQKTGGKWFQINSDTNFLSVLDMLFKKITETVVTVQLETEGNVQKYLEIKSGK